MIHVYDPFIRHSVFLNFLPIPLDYSYIDSSLFLLSFLFDISLWISIIYLVFSFFSGDKVFSVILKFQFLKFPSNKYECECDELSSL